MKSNALSYSFKIWVTALLIAPAINQIMVDLKKWRYHGGISGYISISDQLAAYFFCVFIAGIFSVVTWLLLLAVIYIAIGLFPLKVYPKYIAMGTGILLTIGTFQFVFGWLFHAKNDFDYFMMFTCLCIASGAYFYELKMGDDTGSITI